MQILTTRKPSTFKPAHRPKPPQQETKESVTFSAARGPSIVTWTACGAIPVLGAGVNVLGASADHASTTSARFNVLGAGANLAGTASLAYGLLAGNSTATNAGLGLLGVSGLVAGTTCAALS